MTLQEMLAQHGKIRAELLRAADNYGAARRSGSSSNILSAEHELKLAAEAFHASSRTSITSKETTSA